MTKKDYELIARALKYANETSSEMNDEAIKWVVACFSMRLKNDNSRFDEVKFWKACGLK